MKRRVVFGLFVIAGFLSVPASASALNFLPSIGSPLTFSSPSDQVLASAVGDFDNDDYDDVASVGTGGINVSLSDGNASFTTAIGSPYGASSTREMIFAADLNGDGDMDLLTRNGPATFETWLGNGDGTFPSSPASTVTFTNPLGSRFSADLKNIDGDTDPDLVVGQTEHRFAVALNNGSGVFTASASVNVITDEPVPDHRVYSVAIGDYDGDGNQDLAMGMRNLLAVGNVFDYAQGVYFAKGTGSGTFVPPEANLFGYTPGTSMASLDLNNDSYDDLSYVLPYASTVYTALGSATGLTLNPDENGRAPIPGAEQQVIADINDDGLDDIVTASPSTQSLGAALNQDHAGKLTSLHGHPYPLPQIGGKDFNPEHVVAGDFNNDGLTDLAADSTDPANPATAARGIHVMLNAPEPTSPQEDLHFQGVDPGSFQDKSVTLQNNSLGVGLGVEDVSIEGDTDRFEVINETCTPTVSGGSNCQVDVRFQPDAVGTYSATLVFEFTGGVEPLSIPLSGNTAANYTVDPETLEFGESTAGYSSDAKFKDVTFTSTGGAGVYLGAPVITGPNASMFSVVDPDPCDLVLNAGLSCTIQVKFSPRSNTGGPMAAQLAIGFTNDPTPAAVQLEGTALQAGYAVTPATKDFGEAKVGTGITRTEQDFAVTSTGDAMLPINEVLINGPDAGSFSITSNNCALMIQPLEVCGVKVAFDPKSGPAGPRKATLVVDAFSSTAPGARSIPLTGTATVDPPPPAPDLSIKLKSASKVKRGKTLVVKAIVKNTGTATASSIQLKTTVPGKLAKKPKAIKVSSLAAGKSITKKIKVKVKKSAKKGAKLKVKVVASATGVSKKTASRTVKVK